MDQDALLGIGWVSNTPASNYLNIYEEIPNFMIPDLEASCDADYTTMEEQSLSLLRQSG